MNVKLIFRADADKIAYYSTIIFKRKMQAFFHLQLLIYIFNELPLNIPTLSLMSNTIFTLIKYTSNQLYINGLFTYTISTIICNCAIILPSSQQMPSKIVLANVPVGIWSLLEHKTLQVANI